MPLPDEIADRPVRRLPVTWLVLLASLAPTIYVWWQAREHVIRHLPNDASLPWLVLGGGLGISALLFGLVWKQDRHRRDAEMANEALRRRDAEFVALNAELERRIAARTAELKTANEDLLRFKAVIEATSDIVAMATMDGRTIYANQSGLRLLKFPPGTDANRITWGAVYPPDVIQMVMPALMRDGFWSGEARMLAQSGEELPVAAVGLVVKSPEGVPLYMACIAQDISARKAAEKQLQSVLAELQDANAELLRFKAIADATSDFINITDMEGRILYMNAGGRRMVGIGLDEDITKLSINDLIPPHTKELFEREGFPTAFREGMWKGEAECLRRDGHLIPTSLVGIIVKAADGRPLFMGAIARDIAAERHAAGILEDALAEEKELNRLKGNFISMVTHEIRTPLALILGSSEILSRYLDRLMPEKRAAHLKTIDSSVQRMSGLLEDVLLFSKAEAGRMEFSPVEMDLKNFCATLVDELLSATNRRCPIEFSCDISDPARADENLLRHIFSNLVSNAVKYSPPGTPVKFSVACAGGDAVFVVQDRGMGIPEEDQKRLFTPFYRGKNVTAIQGTGLGLVIVKHCVERHGGSLDLASGENPGTAATVRLPLFSPAHTDFIRRLSEKNHQP